MDAASGAAQITVSIPGQQEIEVITVDETLYLRGAPGLPEGQWVKLPVEQMQSIGVDASAIDPTQTLRLLRGVADGVRQAGTETIRGVEATRYVGEIDVRKLAVADQPVTTTSTLEMYDWGVDVDISAPDPADVVEVDENGRPVLPETDT